jgi:hypothetical protein
MEAYLFPMAQVLARGRISRYTSKHLSDLLCALVREMDSRRSRAELSSGKQNAVGK